MQKLDVSAVMAPSALGNSAEISAMTKITCTGAGRWPSTIAGNILSPAAVTPTDGAYRYSKPPRNRNSNTTPSMMMLSAIMFFCESPRVRTEMFFCIIS